MYKCEICNKEYKLLNGLQIHLVKCHKMDIAQIEEYYVKYYKKEGEGVDPITGNPTEFISMKRGYKKYEKDNPSKFSTNTVEHHMRMGLSFEDAQDRVNKMKRSVSNYLKNDWKELKKSGRTRGGWSKQHFIELGYTDEEAEIEVKKRSVEREKKMAVHRETARKTGEYKMHSPTCIEYYINLGMTYEEAKAALKQRQATNTLETYTKKYGEIDGLIKFKERNLKWSLKMEDMYHDGKYSRDSNKNGNGICNRVYSLSEKELSIVLYDIVEKKCENYNFFSVGTGKGQQYNIFADGKNYYYDITFICGDRKRIIEFNGDFWHMNPKIYKSTDYNTAIELTAQEIWDRFNKKMSVAESNGFKTLVVWEDDWNNRRDDIIKECINFLIYN